MKEMFHPCISIYIMDIYGNIQGEVSNNAKFSTLIDYSLNARQCVTGS